MIWLCFHEVLIIISINLFIRGQLICQFGMPDNSKQL